VDSKNNSVCLGCMYLFENEVLNEYEHTPGPGSHYSICYRCNLESGDMFSGAKCAHCRRPSRKKLSAFLIDKASKNIDSGASVRIFDGSVLSICLTTFIMGILSTKITMENPMIANSGVNDYFGERGEGGQLNLSHLFTMWDIQQLARDTWWYYFMVSTYFMYRTRGSFSMLIDNRGSLLLLIPFFTGIMTHFNLDVASWMTILPLLPFVFDIYFKKNFIGSKRFTQFNHRFPQLECMSTNIINESKGCTKFTETFAYNFLYWDIMGSIAQAYNSVVLDQSGKVISKMVNLFVNASCIVASNGFAHCDASGDTAGKVFAVLNVFIIGAVGTGVMLYDFANKKPVFNFKQLGLFLFSSFALQHSEILQDMFVVINFGSMAVILLVLFVALVCLCASLMVR